MGIGKEIKVTLVLDDAGFSVRGKQAAEVVKNLESNLGGLSKSTNQVESSISELSNNLKGFTDGFGALQKSLQSTVDSLQRAVTGSFDKMATTTKEATKVAKDAAAAQIDAKIKTLENELETNRKMLEARGKLHAELRKLESDERAKSTAAMMNAEKAERGKKAGAQAVISENLNEADRFERNANAIRSEIMATEQWIASTRIAQTERITEIGSLERERVATLEVAAAKETLGRVAAAVGRSNAAEIERIRKQAAQGQKESDLAAAKSAEDLARLKRQYAEQEVRDRRAAEEQMRREAAETAAAQKRAARDAAEEAARQSKQVAQMWKGMAQLYASSKIEQGLMGSVKSADDYQRVMERLDAMGLQGAEGKANTLSIAKQVEAANPNMSSTDALKLTLATTAGAVNTDPKIAGQIVPEIAKLTTVMTRLFPEQAHNIEQFTQNMMGVFESRGIANDPEKMRSSLDNLARALLLTQGKLSVQDYETIGRRGGAGNAQFKNDESILYDIAAASQLKVAGGGGGGAGGVSTFATMQKQAAKGAQGGVLEKHSALENLVEFGVIDKDELLAANGNQPLGRQAKAVAYIGAEEASVNMTKFAMGLVNNVKAKLAALPESDTRFFAKGVDRKDDQEQAKAFGRWADQSFSNVSRAEFYKQFATRGSQERIGAEVKAAKDAPTVDETHKNIMESYGIAVDKAEASLSKLGNVVGKTLIPVLQPLLELMSSFIDKTTEFAENNPAAAKFGILAASVLGVNLALRGTASMFGALGSVKSILDAFVGSSDRTAATADGLATSTGRATREQLANLAASARQASAHSDLAQAQLRAAKAAVSNASENDRLRLITNTLIPAQTQAAAAATAHTTAQTALQSAQRASSLGSRVLSGALGLLGGPIGAIITGLTIATAAWEMFGNEAGKAARKAKQASDDSAKSVQDAIKRLKDETLSIRKGEDAPLIENERNEVATLRKKLAILENDKRLADSQGPMRNEGAEFAAVTRKEKLANDIKDLKKTISAREDALDTLVAERGKREVARAEQEAATKKDAKRRLTEQTKEFAEDSSTGLTDTKGLFKEHKARPDRDPLNAALENAKGEINAQKEKLGAIVLGAETVDSLKRQAYELIEGKRKADEFSPNHDANRRPDANDPRILQLKDEIFQKMLLAEQTKAVEFANERMAATGLEADAALTRMADGGTAKQTDAFRALSRELERAEQRIGAGAASFDKWNRAKNAALFNQAVTDTSNFAVGYVDKNKADNAKLLATEKERIDAELKAAREKEDKLYQMHLETLEKARQASVASAADQAEIDGINLRAQQAREGAEREYQERRRIRSEEEVRATESATARMTREWKDYGKAIDDIGASAANSFVSMLTGSLSSGRLQVGDFVRGVLTDIANAKLKQTLADPLKDVINAGGNWVKSNVFGMAGDASATAATTAKATADTTAATAATATTTALTMMTTAISEATYALQSMAMSSSAGGGGGFLGSIGSFFGSSGGSEAGSEAGAEVMENFLFADGGIMTSMGPMQLRKYANGGIANSPQVAIYGEAGPEAYVPLPDGRSIPVTMQGGGGQSAPSVQVNVINQTSQPVNAQQGGVRFDGKAYILDVVMTAASTPGAFRNNMKDAMK